MMANSSDLQYTADHEWVLVEGNVATIGVTQFAADQLGDIVYVDLPKIGATIAQGKIIGEIESTKSVGELFAPVDGTVIAANEAVVATPELVNSDPVGEGWLIKVEFATLPELLDLASYTALTAE
jgi:glycine cleavage system H protein